jgi:hypothetical protein
MLSDGQCHLQVEYYSWKLENRYQRNPAYKVTLATALMPAAGFHST